MFHVKHQVPQQQEFVSELLLTLKEEKFRPRGWWHFFCRSWERSCQTARTYPTLTASWLQLTLIIFLLALFMEGLSFLYEGPTIALRLLPGFLFCVCWQQSDLFWHLGLHKDAHTRKVFPQLGLANNCTWLRGLCASFLLGRLIGGVPTSTSLAFSLFTVGVVTDILDGSLARRMHTQSQLGLIADGEADFCLYLALTLILMQNSLVPLWLAAIFCLRFVLPLCAALLSYFVLARPVQFGSTVWGKLAGLAQCLYVLLLMAPTQFTSFTEAIQLPLLVITIILMVGAPLAQILINLSGISDRKNLYKERQES